MSFDQSGLLARRACTLFALVATTSLQAQSTPSEGALCETITGGTPGAQAARATAQSMITAKPGSATAAFLNGCLVFGDGKADKAANFFEVATGKEQRSLYFDWLGRAYGDQAQKANKLKQPFLARKTKNAFDEAVKLDPNNIDAHNYLVQFYQMAPGIMGGSNEKALAEIATMRKINPYRGAFAMVNYQQREKNTKAAEAELNALVKAFPDSAAPYQGLVNIAAGEKRWADAFKAADMLHARRTNLGDYAVGRITALSGEQLERGEAAMRRYLTTTPAANEPTLANAHFRLGQIMEHRKAVAEAKTQYQETLRLQPDHADAKKALTALK